MSAKVWSAQELNEPTPAERDAVFEAGRIRDLDKAPQDFLSRVRARFLDRLDRGEITVT